MEKLNFLKQKQIWIVAFSLLYILTTHGLERFSIFFFILTLPLFYTAFTILFIERDFELFSSIEDYLQFSYIIICIFWYFEIIYRLSIWGLSILGFIMIIAPLIFVCVTLCVNSLYKKETP